MATYLQVREVAGVERRTAELGEACWPAATGLSECVKEGSDLPHLSGQTDWRRKAPGNVCHYVHYCLLLLLVVVIIIWALARAAASEDHSHVLWASANRLPPCWLASPKRPTSSVLASNNRQRSQTAQPWTSLCIVASNGWSFLAMHRVNGYALRACHQMMMIIVVIITVLSFVNAYPF